MKHSIGAFIVWLSITANIPDIALFDTQLDVLLQKINQLAQEELLEKIAKAYQQQFKPATKEPELTESDLRDISILPKAMQPAARQAILERKRKELKHEAESLD